MTMKKIVLRAYDVAGNEVKMGDLVIDFRGDKARFGYPSRAPSPGRTGKVVVDVGGEMREFYQDVFALTVKSVEV